VTTSASAKLVAVEATEDEKRERDALCHEAWGTRLSVGEFVDREVELRKTPFARHSMKTWLLVEEGGRSPLASLETYEVASRHGIRGGRSFEIASVYTAPMLRGLGHATQLVRLVGEQLARLPGAQAMTLYSDVGDEIYARAGYAPRPAMDWRIPAARDTAAKVARVDGDAAVAAVLDAHPPRGRFALVPSFEQIGWHRARERIYAARLDRPIVQHGVLACDGGHALLAGDLKNERLLVLAWWAENTAAAARLAAAAADEAARVGLGHVNAWASIANDDDPFTVALPWVGAELQPREGSLPMVRPLPAAPGLVASAWRDIPRALWV
jgi:hypothetical protein